jgi:hypothetical protein
MVKDWQLVVYDGVGGSMRGVMEGVVGVSMVSGHDEEKALICDGEGLVIGGGLSGYLVWRKSSKG